MATKWESPSINQYQALTHLYLCQFFPLSGLQKLSRAEASLGLSAFQGLRSENRQRAGFCCRRTLRLRRALARMAGTESEEDVLTCGAMCSGRDHPPFLPIS
jgi:hypothetical protein